MEYSEAFKKLGYDLGNPRQDWSASNDTGVCLAIWRDELIKTSAGLPMLDTRKVAAPIEIWGRKPGNKLRIKHLAEARDRFAGVVDVLIVAGAVGISYDDADPWIPAQRKGARWHLTYFDETTGHYAVEVRKA